MLVGLVAPEAVAGTKVLVAVAVLADILGSAVAAATLVMHRVLLALGVQVVAEPGLKALLVAVAALVFWELAVTALAALTLLV